MVPLKYVSSFWRTLINCEINVILTWSINSVLSNATANQATTLAVTDTKLYCPIVTLSTNNNGKLFQQLKPRFKCTINWNKSQSQKTTQMLQTNI